MLMLLLFKLFSSSSLKLVIFIWSVSSKTVFYYPYKNSDAFTVEETTEIYPVLEKFYGI